MTVTDKIRFFYFITLVFNLWLIGEYNIKGILAGILIFGFIALFECIIIPSIPLNMLSEKELYNKLKRTIKMKIISDIHSIQKKSKHIKSCYIIAMSSIYVLILASNSFPTNLTLSFFSLIIGTVLIGSFFHSILFLYIYFKNIDKVKKLYQHYLKPNESKKILINIIQNIQSEKIKHP